MSQLDVSSHVLDGIESREGITGEERDRKHAKPMCMWAPVSVRHQPGMPPLSLAKFTKQHPDCLQEDRDQIPLVCCTFYTSCLAFYTSCLAFFFFKLEFLFAAITPPGTNDDNWPLCMLDVRLMAKETIQNCSGEEKHAMGDCIRGTTLSSQILCGHEY